MGFKIGTWWHDAPDIGFDTNGKQAIVRHLCFSPLETRIWYKLIDGQYCREIHFIEGLQGGEQYIDFISKSEMLKVMEKARIYAGRTAIKFRRCSQLECSYAVKYHMETLSN